MAACCKDLVLALDDERTNSEISKLVGVYRFDYDHSKLEEIENGNFTFKKEKGNKYIFKNNEGQWSVGIESY